MTTFTTFSAQFLLSLLPKYTNIPRPRISFGVKTTDIDNQYDIYSRKCAYGSSMIEGFDFTVSYAPVAGTPPPLYYHRNCICRRPHYFCLGYLQFLQE